MTQYSKTGEIQQYSNIQPVWKFVFLYIITFSIYEIPWGHKHWKFIKEREGLQLNAWLRSWFLPFTLFWLAKRIFALAEDKGYPEKPSPGAITALFWFFIVLVQLPDPLGYMFFFFSLFPLLTILKAANFYWEKEQPNLPIRTSWTGGEIAWTVFGVILWLFILIVAFASTEV
jgi:hypothetical protein